MNSPNMYLGVTENNNHYQQAQQASGGRKKLNPIPKYQTDELATEHAKLRTA
jgi:hypothetical protein